MLSETAPLLIQHIATGTTNRCMTCSCGTITVLQAVKASGRADASYFAAVVAAPSSHRVAYIAGFLPGLANFGLLATDPLCHCQTVRPAQTNVCSVSTSASRKLAEFAEHPHPHCAIFSVPQCGCACSTPIANYFNYRMPTT